MKSFLTFISEATIKQELPKNVKVVDPALLTLKEYSKIANKGNKHHPSNAYDWTLEKMNEIYDKPEESFPKIINATKIKGINFEIRAKVINCYTDQKFAKMIDGKFEYIEGEPQYYTPEELKKMGKAEYTYEFCIIEKDTNKVVAISSDEWGAILVVVASEYRGFGLGQIISKLTRKHLPEKDSGGFTNSGYRTFEKIHREFVRDYVKSGKYTKLIKAGEITKERVRDIIISANLNSSKPKSKISFDKEDSKFNIDPSQWLLFSENSEFIIYDKRLAEVWEDDDLDDLWKERLFIGMIYASEGYGTYENELYLHHFGAINKKVKQTLLMLQLSDCKLHKEQLRISKKLMKLVDPDKIKVKEGRERDEYLISLKGKGLSFTEAVEQEKKFRKSIKDVHDEFKIYMMEKAYSIYDNVDLEEKE